TSLNSLRKRGYRSRGCESCGEPRTDQSGSHRSAWRTGTMEAPGSPHLSHQRNMCVELSAMPPGFAQVSHRPDGERSPGLLDARRQVLHDVERLAILADQAGDAVHAVHDGRVVAAAELGADLGQRL